MSIRFANEPSQAHKHRVVTALASGLPGGIELRAHELTESTLLIWLPATLTVTCLPLDQCGDHSKRVAADLWPPVRGRTRVSRRPPDEADPFSALCASCDSVRPPLCLARADLLMRAALVVAAKVV